MTLCKKLRKKFPNINGNKRQEVEQDVNDAIEKLRDNFTAEEGMPQLFLLILF